MQEYFEIHPSRVQLGLLICGHGVLAIALAAYVEPVTMKLGAILLTGLLGWRESRRLCKPGKLLLHCNPRTTEIALQCGDRPHQQPYIYYKYKVYATRWFAILKLVDNDNCRTLILNPDRFDSVHSYHRLRFLLMRLDEHRAA